MTKEKGKVPFGTRDINFYVRRSPKRRTVGLFVDPHEGVFLRAPAGISLSVLSRLVHSKGAWILKKQKQIEAIQPFLPRREFVTGETYYYLGRTYRLKVQSLRDMTKPSVHLTQGRFCVRLNGHYTVLGRKRVVRKTLGKWYKKRASCILRRRLGAYAKTLNVACPDLILANQSRRWGSCNHKGVIRLNWHIVMAPMSLVDYVVAHELCHIVHHNHSYRFWNLLARLMPDYGERRVRLRKEGLRYSL